MSNPKDYSSNFLNIYYNYIYKIKIMGDNIMTDINKWRNKRLNRKCTFCIHYNPIYHTCKAKDKYIKKTNTKRPFCVLFKLINGGNNDGN